MAAERLTLNPILDDSANSPLELSGQDGSLSHGILLLDHSYPPPGRVPQWVSSADTEGELIGNTRYTNREVSLTLRVAEPSETTETNLCTNPKCAVDTTGWTNSGLATMERKTLYGSQPDGVAGVGADTALHVVGNSDLDYAYDDISVTSGQSYTLTGYVYLLSNTATGVRLTIHNAAGAALKANTSTFATTGTWTRLEVSVTADATATWRFGIQQVGAGAADAYLTGVQITNASASTAYFDGDSPGCSWSGTHHASTSTRPATSGTRFYRILEDLQQWADRTVREGGTLMRVPPGGEPMIFDVLDAQVDVPADNSFIHSRRAMVGLSLTCKPFARGQWVTLSDHTETTLPVITGTDTGIKGEVPALGRLTIDEDDADDQFWVSWGVRSKNYSSAATAALFWQAESLTALGASTTTAGASGASGSGSNVIRNTDLSTNYVAIASTQATGGGSHMSHIGTYRVWARLFRPTSNGGAVSVALEWAEGDFRKRNTNTSVDFAADEREGAFTITDLGLVNLSKVVSGTQRWEGRIFAKSTVAGDEIDVDCIWLQPADECVGIAKGTLQPQVPTSWSALSTFDTESGAINGDSATVGGAWASTGDATDFSVAAGVATRAEVSDADTNTGRYCASGVSAFAAQTVQIDFKRSASPATFLQGVLARYTDANNWAMFGYGQALGVSYWFFTKRVAGTTSALAPSLTTSSGFGSWPFFPTTDQYWTIRFSVDAAGRWVANAAIQGNGFKQLASGVDSALATGGSLATGKPGFYDANTTATACTRTYDNFASWGPFTDMAMFASQSLQIREDTAIREDSSGAIWGPVSSYTGGYALLPISGREERTLETLVKACRNDPDTMTDGGIDDISYQWQYAPRWITTPEPT